MLSIRPGFICLLSSIVLAAPELDVARQDAYGAAGPTATIDSGVVIGVQTSVVNSPNLVNQYLGVPFAASPTRFAPAQTATPWSQPYEATERGAACIQQFNYPESLRNFNLETFNTPAPVESEDCLTVNVFASASAQKDDELKPVMFWIYGGNLEFGWNGAAVFDGSSFAANQDVVIVATNYRTNVFGFPSSPSLPITASNLGYLDQRLALAWVQRNIRAFGGDPNRVTLFGQSAGAFGVDSLITTFGPSAPDGPPPFHAAIMQSGQSSVSARPSYNESVWGVLVDRLNCTSGSPDDELSCARAAPAAALKSIIEHLALSFMPVSDNYTQLQYPEAARRDGQIARVPVITGTDADEGTIFTFTLNDTRAFLRANLPSITDSRIDFILATYPIDGQSITSPTEQIAVSFMEAVFQCPCAVVANDSAAAGIPTWRYLYNGSFPNAQAAPVPGLDLGAYHGSEIPIVFGTYAGFTDEGEEAVRLSELVQGMWASFARNPMDGPAPGWEETGDGYVEVIGGRGGADAMGRLRRGGSAVELDKGRCEVWSSYFGLS